MYIRRKVPTLIRWGYARGWVLPVCDLVFTTARSNLQEHW